MKISAGWFALALGLVVLAPRSGAAQDATGTWIATPTSDPADNWTVVLRTVGNRVLGAVSSCSTFRPIEIFSGEIHGDEITFKCRSNDGYRVLAFRGTVAASTIRFSWTKEVQLGGTVRDDDRTFGAGSATTIVVTRTAPASGALADVASAARIPPNVPFERILHADQEPQNWLSYSGTLDGHRFSGLTALTRANVQDLGLAWLWQMEPRTAGGFEATPLVVDGVMYTVRPPGLVVALNAATGQRIWTLDRLLPEAVRETQGNRAMRGLALAGELLFVGTPDAHLLAIDAYSGKLVWDTVVADARDADCEGGSCYGISLAPLVVKDAVVVGVTGGASEGSIRGFIAAYAQATGEELWKFHAIPGPGEPGHETWGGDSWRTGGVGIWHIGAYDPDADLIYWGTGNPRPQTDGSTRPGDNLYSNAVVALDADSGALAWHYQFTPHDEMDWDAAQVPVLADLDWAGRLRRVLLWANRNGLFYVLDRLTGEFLAAEPFVSVNWLSGFDERGRPVRVLSKGAENMPIRPGYSATNWWSPSFSQGTGWYYVASQDASVGADGRQTIYHGAIQAIDPRDLGQKWEFKIPGDVMFWSGALTTASNLLFTATWSRDSTPNGGEVLALDALTGELLWKFRLPAQAGSGLMTYAVGGRQFVAVIAKDTLFAFALP